jgi:hypothetical protein
MRHCAGAAILAVVISSAAAAQTFDPKARTITCSGPFAKNSSHAKVVEAFGRENVTYLTLTQTVEGDLPHTVIFPNDPKSRLLIFWNDDKNRRTVASIFVRAESQWATAKGVRIGSTLADVQTLNGKPFRMTGFFDSSSSGSVTNWQGGALSMRAAGCASTPYFAADPAAPPAALSKVKTNVMNPKLFLSSDAAVQATSPRVYEISVGFNE